MPTNDNSPVLQFVRRHRHALTMGASAAIVLTMDHPASALHAAHAIRRDYPQTQLFARARDESHGAALLRAGASLVVPETLESGLQLSRSVLYSLGFPEPVAEQAIQQARLRHIGAVQDD